MKVIFLDIDGVLNSRSYDQKRDWTKQTAIDESRLPLVKEIVDRTGALIVLSSSWRTDWERNEGACAPSGQYINDTFKKFGLKIFDKTPYDSPRADRCDEVRAWLEAQGSAVTAYAILDDYGFGWKEFSDKLVKTNPHFGLGLEQGHVEKAVALLGEDK